MDTEMIFQGIFGYTFITYQALVQIDSVLVLSHTSSLHDLLCGQVFRIYFSFSNFLLQQFRLFNENISFIVEDIGFEVFSNKMRLSEMLVHVACCSYTFLTNLTPQWIDLHMDQHVFLEIFWI